jgi:flavodoxin
MVKTLVVYYTRTGNTKKVSEEIAKNLKADSEEIIDLKSRKGALGWLGAGKDAYKQLLTKIDKTKKDSSKYDLVVIGTPIWASKMVPAIRTYITKEREKFKQVAFFCTAGGESGDKTFKGMQELCKKKPKASLHLYTKEVVSGTYLEKVKSFSDNLK